MKENQGRLNFNEFSYFRNYFYSLLADSKPADFKAVTDFSCLLQKSLDFHQSPGGIFRQFYPLKVINLSSEERSDDTAILTPEERLILQAYFASCWATCISARGGAALVDKMGKLLVTGHSGSPITGAVNCEQADCLLRKGGICNRAESAEENAMRCSNRKKIERGWCITTHEPTVKSFLELVVMGINRITFFVNHGQKSEAEKQYLESVCQKQKVSVEHFTDLISVWNKALIGLGIKIEEEFPESLE